MLISQVVDALTAIQADPSLKPLVYIVPVEAAALEESGWSPTALEDYLQEGLTENLRVALQHGPPSRSEPSDDIHA